MMAIKLIEAQQIPTPYEVIVHSKGRGGNLYRAEILRIDSNTDGDLHAIGVDPFTRRKISLAPNTKVELARPIVI